MFHRLKRASAQAFTLVEIIAAVGVLFLLLTILLAVTNSVSTTVRRTSTSIDAFSAARLAFDLMNQKLSQATLNTYWDYDNVLEPKHYLRQSDLQFVVQQNTVDPNWGQEVYFQSPESYARDATVKSTEGLLNTCSFFVQYGTNQPFTPDTTDDEKFRYRLMHGIIPTELSTFHEDISQYLVKDSSGKRYVADDAWKPTWFDNISNGTIPSDPAVAPLPIADNVIALIIWPRKAASDDPQGDDLTTNFLYDSKLNSFPTAGASAEWEQPIQANQLPPTLQVTLITISESSAARIDTKSATPPGIIQSALSGKFTKVADYAQDLIDVSEALTEANIEFHIANTSVPLRESKWSDIR